MVWQYSCQEVRVNITTATVHVGITSLARKNIKSFLKDGVLLEIWLLFTVQCDHSDSKY